ncbi:MAG: LysR family transcriptional regulator, partial [Burkholderiaceae bacterium]
MDIRTFEFFMSLAATNSFSRTATMLGTTQSSVSKSIAAMERECATRLFDRSGRGAALSPEGRLLLPRVEALVRDASGLNDFLVNARSIAAGSVQLATQPSIGWPLVSYLLGVLARDYPNIRIQISEGTTNSIEEWLSDGRCELAVVSRAASPRYAESTRLFSLPMYLVAPPSNPLMGLTHITFEAATRLPLVMGAALNGGRLLLEEHAKELRLPLNVVEEVNSFYLIKRIVRSGSLYTITTYTSVEEELQKGDLAGVAIVQPTINQTFYLSVASRRV